MSNNIITIDVGNTNVSCCVYDASLRKLQMEVSLPSKEIKKAALYKCFLDFKDKFVPKRALISSVVPDNTKKIIQALEELDIKSNVIIPNEEENILLLDVKGAKELGADIFCGCVEATRYAKSTITIDMGTAITVALVKDYRFVACAIYPGVDTSFGALFKDTALLDKVKKEQLDNLIGGDTNVAIMTGIVYGTVGALKEMISKYKEVAPDAKVVFTGGASRDYIKYFDDCIYEKHLIHLGLIDIYERKVGK